jgi:predicted O-methyltransferase YrrM
MDFLPENINSYVEAHTQDETNLLKELEKKTWLNVLMPRMLSGKIQGQVLRMLALMIKPKRILEIGTYTGYSALCFADALENETDELITIDINEQLKDFVQPFFNQHRNKNKIKYLLGNALDIIPTLNKNFDLVFIDADKENYLNYYHILIDDLPKNSFIIADNVLWSGKVTQNPETFDKDTLALHQFNEYVSKDSRVENVLFPIRDGLMILRKL